MRTSRRLGTLGLLLLLLPALASAAAAGLLDGKTFAGETGKVGETTGDKDGFVFANGTFRSTVCDRYGFAAAPYTANRKADGSIAFTAETASATEGKMAWKGTVKGGALDGTVAWSKPGQKTIDYWFKGKLQKGA